MEIAADLKEEGVQLAATGEMGIGNTTPAAAVASVLTGKPVERMTGRGTGLDEAGLRRKQEAIRRSLEVNHPDPMDSSGCPGQGGGAGDRGMAGFVLEQPSTACRWCWTG